MSNMTAGCHCVGSLLLFLILVILPAAQTISVIAPNTFRLGAEETVGVISESQTPEDITLHLQDYPGRQRRFSQTTVRARRDDPQIARLRVDPYKIPNLASSNDKTKHYVLLVAEGRNFRKEVPVIIGMRSGYMFIQTDKPIYTPKQTVHVRIIPLNQDMLTDKQNFTVQIRNPQNMIVDNTPSSKLDTKHGLYAYNFEFPSTASEGEWSVVVIYGHKNPSNETVSFELKQYTLPTYGVKLKLPEVILPVSDSIKVGVEAKYVYGKKVEGTVICKFGVKSETKKKIYVGIAVVEKLKDGLATCSINRTTFAEHKKVGWFDTISGSRLVVEAEVIEKATGERETASSSTTLFSKTKYLVDFTRSLRDFTPGYTVAVQADIREATGKKAPNVPARVQARDEKGRVITPENNQWEDTSNEDGRVSFFIPTGHDIKKLYITVTTDDPDLAPNLEGVRTHEMSAVTSATFVSLDRTTISNTLSVGNDFTSNVYCSPFDMPVSFVVTANGRVVRLGSLAIGNVRQRTVHLRVTDQMIPSFRITLFAVHQGRTLTDSVRIDVQDECRAQAKITLETTLTNGEPGKEGTITVRGTEDTAVGLLAVDKAVYVLRNQGLLTKDKMFSRMEEQDLGCGPGGGRDTQSVLANAGLIFFSDASTDAPERPSCAERRLNKRSIRDDVLTQENDTLRECCKVGMYGDKLKRSCEERLEVIERYHEKDGCAEEFLRCCNQTAHLHGSKSAGSDAVGRQEDEDDLDYVPDSEIPEREGKARERSDFRETMVVETGVIGGDKKWELPLSLPHSITTWVIQAIGINPRQGMCVADPIEAVAFQNVFIQLKLPYSVVRNEQVELRATIFNYGKHTRKVTMYMYGVQGLCSEAQPNQRGIPKKVVLSGNGGAETVAFPVVPLETGMFPIKIVAISDKGDDKILQKLNVVAEGIPHEENIVIPIDPANIDKRKQRETASNKYTTRIDEDRKRQHSTVQLRPNQEYIPGTESCLITAIGDKFGPTVHTIVYNPGGLITMPTGCGEQTLSRFAPTVYALHYLKVTKGITAQQEANGYSYIRAGITRMLTFRQPDGSYSFWSHKQPSTWLTAYVTKILCQSRKYVYVDTNAICPALSWLIRSQERDGSFFEKHHAYNAAIPSGISGAVPVTAFVLSTLYKCDCNQVDMTNAKAKAVKYLIQELPRITYPYYLSIVAYALSLADPNEAGHNANELLLQRATVSEAWNHRYWGQAGTALAVETTSFALLTQLIHKNFDVANSIVNWLITQRTASGSFLSTKDTVLAIEALAEYATNAGHGEMNLSCNMTSTNDAQFNKVISFTPENARALRSYELSKLGGLLRLEAQGTGVALVNVQLKYNVPRKLNEICKFDINITVTDAKEDKLPKKTVEDLGHYFRILDEDMLEELALEDPPQNLDDGRVLESPAHSLEMDMIDIPQDIADTVLNGQPGRRFKRAPGARKRSNSKYVANITVCVQYLYHQDSNMAIADVGVFTGYQVIKPDLARIAQDPTIPVSHCEIAGRSVVFYLDQISHQEKTCFWFRVVREFIVSPMESSVVRVYDYYNPGHACSKFFSPNQHSAIIQKVCTGKICRCAEGGCPPKDPFMDIMQEDEVAEQRSALLEKACENEYFVWKMRVDNVKKDNSSFQTVDVTVLRVLREGRESRDDVIANPQRQFLGRTSCDSVSLTIGKTYIIIGTDNEPIQQEDGIVRYLYYISKQTFIYEWFPISDRRVARNKTAEARELQKSFNWLETKFVNDGGCNH